MLRKPILFAILALVVTFLIAGAYLYFTRPTWQTYKNKELEISLDWPDTFERRELTKRHRDANYVFSVECEKPKALFSLRHEAGLGPLKMTGGSVMDALVSAVNRRYPSRYPDYEKELFEEKIVANEKASLFEFTYTGADGETKMRQRLIIVVRNEEAYYLIFQAPEKSFSKSELVFDRITESLEFL